MKRKYIQFLVLVLLTWAAVYLLPSKLANMLNSRGVRAYNENDFPSAIDFYKKAIVICPSAQAYFNLGAAYEQTGDAEKAISAFKKVIEYDPGYQDVYKALAEIYAARGDDDAAKKYLNDLDALGHDTDRTSQDINDEKIVRLYNQGVRFYDLKQAEAALDKFNQVIEIDKGHYLAYKAAADIYLEQGNLSQAMRYYKKIIALGHQDADVLNRMGIICMRLEDYNSAIMYLKRTNKIAPENANYLYSLASILRDSNHLKEALSYYEKLVFVSPEYPNVHNDIGGIYDALGVRDKAEQEYQKEEDIVSQLIKQGFDDNFTLTRLAVAYNGIGKTQQAERILNKIILEDPNYLKAYYARAQVYRKLSEQPKANADLLKAKQLNKKAILLSATGSQQAKRSHEKNTQKESGFQNADLFVENAVIYMNNGHIFRGKILLETQEKVVVEVKTGNSTSEITFHKSKIKDIKKIN